MKRTLTIWIADVSPLFCDGMKQVLRRPRYLVQRMGATLAKTLDFSATPPDIVIFGSSAEPDLRKLIECMQAQSQPAGRTYFILLYGDQDDAIKDYKYAALSDLKPFVRAILPRHMPSKVLPHFVEIIALGHQVFNLHPEHCICSGARISNSKILSALPLRSNITNLGPDSPAITDQETTLISRHIILSERERETARLLPATKFFLDIMIASIILLFLAPLLALIVLLIRIDSPGPVLFRQTRTGLQGKKFQIYKFRTMTVQENGDVICQATRDDTRMTWIGRVLRKMSIDELPQLLNVLKGEMSLVGPRPHALAHDEYYGQRIPDYRKRFIVRPGITGWAQVNGARGPTPRIADMERRIELDIWYIQNASLFLDARILLRTIANELTYRRDAF